MEIHKTKDIFEAAWIHSQGTQLLRLEPDDHYCWFVFSNFWDISENLAQKYWSQQATGDIKKYVNSLKTLKDLIFSQTYAYKNSEKSTDTP